MHRSHRESEITTSINNLLYQYDSGQQKYINEFMKMYKSAADLLVLGIYPNGKEITESFGAFNAIRSKLKHDLSDPNHTVVCIADEIVFQ